MGGVDQRLIEDQHVTWLEHIVLTSLHRLPDFRADGRSRRSDPDQARIALKHREGVGAGELRRDVAPNAGGQRWRRPGRR